MRHPLVGSWLATTGSSWSLLHKQLERTKTTFYFLFFFKEKKGVSTNIGSNSLIVFKLYINKTLFVNQKLKNYYYTLLCINKTILKKKKNRVLK